jgi:hypothetical protein
MDLDILIRHQRERILYECVSGGRAYGTANAQSDTDIRTNVPIGASATPLAR